MTLNPKIRLLVNFPRFWAATRISRVNSAKMAGDRPRQPAYMKFSALHVDFRSPTLKSGYLFAIGLSIVKTVADRHRHVAYHNKHQWRAF